MKPYAAIRAFARFEPDYRNIVSAARNKPAKRLPLYEHIVDISHMESKLGRKFSGLNNGGSDEIAEFFKNVCEFFLVAGYDSVSWEFLLGKALPGSGALDGSKPGVIRNREDFERYPWDEVPDLYFRQYDKYICALRDALPAGMKMVGGVGNGVFECVQELVGYTGLCYMSLDDEELYRDIFRRIGSILVTVWNIFLKRYGDMLCICRMGDDLGYKSSTLISPADIRELILPEYEKIVGSAHAAGKPFLLHSCGNLFGVFDDIIRTGIDAKHSNEDQIAASPVWAERYGDRIGNFGGIDTDAVCRLDRAEMTEYIHDVLSRCEGHGGIAFGSGNSIPDYVPGDQYFTKLEIVRKYRNDE